MKCYVYSFITVLAKSVVIRFLYSTSVRISIPLKDISSHEIHELNNQLQLNYLLLVVSTHFQQHFKSYSALPLNSILTSQTHSNFLAKIPSASTKYCNQQSLLENQRLTVMDPIINPSCDTSFNSCSYSFLAFFVRSISAQYYYDSCIVTPCGNLPD